MQPVLARFAIGDATLVIYSYTAFLALASVVAVWLGVHGASRLGVGRRRATVGFGLAVAAGVIGARLLDVALDWGAYAEDPSRIVALQARGFALYGGFAAAVVVAVAAARCWRVPAWALADSAVPAVVVGIVLVRIGCFLNGCCAGDVTSLPWGVTFPFGSTAWGQQVLSGRGGLLALGGVVEPVHPTQLYEAGAALLCGAIAIAAARRRSVPRGTTALAFAAGFLLFRAFNQALRPGLPDASLSQAELVVAYAAGAVVVAAVLARRLWTARILGGNVATSAGRSRARSDPVWPDAVPHRHRIGAAGPASRPSAPRNGRRIARRAPIRFSQRAAGQEMASQARAVTSRDPMSPLIPPRMVSPARNWPGTRVATATGPRRCRRAGFDTRPPSG